MERSIYRGFTLIELLIVIAIIGLLTTIATVNFIGIRERARDAQRKSDLAQIQNALEFFRTDMNRYPQTNEFPPSACNGQFLSGSTIYMKKTPCDPSLNQAYYYLPTATNTSYTLYACLENRNDKDENTSTTQPTGGSRCNSGTYYAVTDP